MLDGTRNDSTVLAATKRMTIIIPTSVTSYADSTRTPGDPLGRKYILAQYRSDADLEWVRETRARLVVDELKWSAFKQSEPKLRTDRRLWSRIESGISDATIIVIDTDRVLWGMTARALSDGAELIELEQQSMESIVDSCAAAIVGSTPIAYLPHNLVRVVPWTRLQLLDDLGSFTPEGIREKIGAGLRQAQIFAARAHAIFDLATEDDEAVRTDDVFRSPLARVMLAELLGTPRTFDVEDPNTLPLLNEAAATIADALAVSLPETNTGSSLVQEADSRDIDEMQAADVAAGWASDLLQRGDEKSLAARFKRIWVNGRRLK